MLNHTTPDYPDEKKITLMYLCGVSTDHISNKYGITASTVRDKIVGRQSRKWNDPLVEHYRNARRSNRDSNWAHMFLTFEHDPRPAPWGLIDREDMDLYHAVVDPRLKPGIERLVQRTSWNEYAKCDRPYDLFVKEVLGHGNKDWYMRMNFVNTLNEAYNTQQKIDLDGIFDNAGDKIIDKIRDGGLSWSEFRRSIIHIVMTTLNPREIAVLGDTFGLDGYIQKDRKQMRQTYAATSDRIRHVQAEALRKLRHPTVSGYFHMCSQFATDEEIRNGLCILTSSQYGNASILGKMSNLARKSVYVPLDTSYKQSYGR